MSKRDDIQWLRSLAIFAVLFFHLKPKAFPFGYLGVDMFFVISGYLMTSILSKEISIISFYFSRIKRIFPCYLFLIITVLGAGYFILLPSDYDGLKDETIWSILYVNNLYPIFHQKQYFEMVSEYKFLLHSWSLGVEIQFYLISPFLIRFILSRKNKFLWALLIAVSSFFLQLFSLNEEIAFGLMFCRIWQFLIGTLAFIKQKELNILQNDTISSEILKEDSKNKLCLRKLNFFISTKMLILFFLITVCFFPFDLKKYYGFTIFLQIFCTVITGIFIYSNPLNSTNNFEILNKILVYFGDASFIMYLIHWPIIVYFNYLTISWSLFSSVFCIILLTIFFHECFEKFLSRRTSKFNTALIIVFYNIVFAFLLVAHNNQYNSAMAFSIQENEKQVVSCKSILSRDTIFVKQCKTNVLIEKHFTFRHLKHEYDYLNLFCSITIDSKSNETALIIGNSFVSFEIGAILEAIKKSRVKFSEVFVIAQAHCSLIVGYLNSGVETCKGIDGSHDALLEVLKPDMIIYTGRFARFVNPALESHFDEIKRSILHISKFTRRLIIIEPVPFFDYSINFTNPSTISHALYTNGSIDQYKLPLQTHYSISKGSWNRVEEAVKFCLNCVIVATEQLFCTKDFCHIVDPKTNVSRYCDRGHVTPTESLRMTPFILQAIDA